MKPVLRIVRTGLTDEYAWLYYGESELKEEVTEAIRELGIYMQEYDS